jgi:hypothetical protein
MLSAGVLISLLPTSQRAHSLKTLGSQWVFSFHIILCGVMLWILNKFMYFHSLNRTHHPTYMPLEKCHCWVGMLLHSLVKVIWYFRRTNHHHPKAFLLQFFFLFFFLSFTWAGVEPRPLLLWPLNGLLYHPWMITNDECGAIRRMLRKVNRSTYRNPAPMPLCPPQIPHDLTWATVAGSQ